MRPGSIRIPGILRLRANRQFKLIRLPRRFAQEDSGRGCLHRRERCGAIVGKKHNCLCRPAGARPLFHLPTLHGFAGARLQGGLNNFAPAALGEWRRRQRPQPRAAVPHELSSTARVSVPQRDFWAQGRLRSMVRAEHWSNSLMRSLCDKNPRDAKGSLDFARDFACGFPTPARENRASWGPRQTPAARLNFESAPISQSR
jgi:hypothetical protein